METARTFRDTTLRQAMLRVLQVLGPDAVVVTTREVREGDPGRVVAYEVVAAPGTAKQARPATARPAAPVAPTRLPERTETPVAAPAVPRPARQQPNPAAESLQQALGEVQRDLAALKAARSCWESAATALGALRGELADLERTVEQLRQPGGETDPDSEVQKLVSRGTDRDVARAVVARARDRAAPQGGLGLVRWPDLVVELERSLPATEPLWARRGPSVAALVGPTGAGKTTTLAKIAAEATCVHQRRVAIVTTDVRRVGRVDAARTYASLLGVPFRAAQGRMELLAAVTELSDRDLVLVDTRGHNPWDDAALAEVTALLGSAGVERHLVLPAPWRADELRQMVPRYATFGLSSLLFTKLDEVKGPGAVLSALWGSPIPASHLCSGQEVPGDVEAFSAKALAERIAGRVEPPVRRVEGTWSMA